MALFPATSSPIWLEPKELGPNKVSVEDQRPPPIELSLGGTSTVSVILQHSDFYSFYACVTVIYWRAGASLPSRPNGAIFLYIYPALMYAVMFYIILNKRKLHFPLAKNVMHSPSMT